MIAISITPPPMPSVVVTNDVKPAQAIRKTATPGESITGGLTYLLIVAGIQRGIIARSSCR